jgi:hypothetical protein
LCAIDIIEIESRILKLTSPLSSILTKHRINHKGFVGAVIDLETDGQPFSDEFYGAGRCKLQCAVSCAILNEDYVEVITKTCETPDWVFAKEVEKSLAKTNYPYYAFNAGFDMAILSKLLGKEVLFDRELQQFERQHKGYCRQNLGISNFDDPFHDRGYLASEEWKKHLKTREKECVTKIMTHNLSCVLKEYCILVRGGYRMIDPISFKAFFEEKGELVCDTCQKLPE